MQIPGGRSTDGRNALRSAGMRRSGVPSDLNLKQQTESPVFWAEMVMPVMLNDQIRNSREAVSPQPGFTYL